MLRVYVNKIYSHFPDKESEEGVGYKWELGSLCLYVEVYITVIKTELCVGNPMYVSKNHELICNLDFIKAKGMGSWRALQT